MACGAAPIERTTIAPEVTPEVTPSATLEVTTDAPVEEAVIEARDLLSGRFRVELPTGAEPANVWSSEEPGHRDGWRMNYEGCDLFLAASSEGLVRPDELTLGEGEIRTWVPSESAAPRLEVIRTPLRTFATLGEEQATAGAVVFEADGSATDFFVWPDGPEREGFGENGEEDWVAWQRADPAMQECYAAAERLLGEALASLEPQLPFQPRPVRVSFGWDDLREEQAVFVGSLPDGWIITQRDAFDATFDRVHRRQDWSWSPSAPSPRAELWAFSGSDDRPIRGRRVNVFGYPLRFDEEGCARVVEARMPYQQYLCLHGSRAEQEELLGVLQRFLRDSVVP